jgi:hypothetical protein
MMVETVPTSNSGGENQHLMMVEAVPTSDDGGDSSNI